MRPRLFCNQPLQLPRTRSAFREIVRSLLFVVICSAAAWAGDAPGWMHALVNVPLPAHDDKTDAILLYSQTTVNVQSVDKIKETVREAYKILRPGGREYGSVFVYLNQHRKITGLRGWCIPAQGKDYEIKDKEAIEISLPKIENSELVTDVKDRVLHIPAADPGNIIGYEYEVEEQPMLLQEFWGFQESVPVRESHFQLLLPSGWEYKTAWLNHPEIKPTQTGNSSEWVVTDLPGLRKEEDMPPWFGVAGHMIVDLLPPGGTAINSWTNWQKTGNWYHSLTAGRTEASPEIKQKVVALTPPTSSTLGKMKALAQFVQHDIRYVAIELGIGGHQPHFASDTFSHRYGDCKDKVTLMGSMLHEIGVDWYYVLINTQRGAVTPETPANAEFNHAIMAIKLPVGADNEALIATVMHPKLGKLLFFDPTNELTPFGQISGSLQANYGLLVTPDGGELVALPKQSSSMNGIRRTAKFTLDPKGGLVGIVNETRTGDRATYERWSMKNVSKSSDRIKPIESLLSSSVSNFHISKANAVNIDQTDLPFGFSYSFEVAEYAQNAGDLLLVRPRVLGSKASALLETKEPRKFPIEFDGPVLDSDSFEITLPTGYEVDELPPPVDADMGFASYHAKTEVKGNVIGYTRTFEIKELSVPVSQADQLKKFYRIIASDERNTAVLKPAGGK